jgi:hypothetical protein
MDGAFGQRQPIIVLDGRTASTGTAFARGCRLTGAFEEHDFKLLADVAPACFIDQHRVFRGCPASACGEVCSFVSAKEKTRRKRRRPRDGAIAEPGPPSTRTRS